MSRSSVSLRPVRALLVVACSLLGLRALPSAGLAASPVVPPAMIDACKGHPEASACTFSMAGKTIEGVCARLPDGPLACRPGGAPRPKRTDPKAGGQRP